MQAKRPARTKTRPCLIALAALVTGIGCSNAAFAFNPQPDPPAFGLLAIVSGQVAQLNVACSDLPSEVSPGPCRVELAFLDVSGKTLVRQTMALRPGRAASLQWMTKSEGRMQLRPLILLDQGSGPVIPSLEIFDDETGRTELFAMPLSSVPAVQR